MSEQSKRILVTGGSGYIGSGLLPRLFARGYKVTNLDLDLYGNQCESFLRSHDSWAQWAPNYKKIQGDIRDPVAVKEALTGADAVVHLAAISNDPTGELDEYLTRQVNFDAVGMLVSMARTMGVQRFLHASSSSVYGYKEEERIVETLEPNPLSYYAKYKLLSEWVVRAASGSDFVTVCLRPATVCGISPRQRFDLTVNKLTVDAIRKGVITVHGGAQRRPNVAMEDMVEIYLQLLEAPAETINGQVFNFGFENMRVGDIAELIRDELSALPVRIEVVEKTDPRDFHMCSDKIRDALGYRPHASMRSAIRDLHHQLVVLGAHPDEEADEYYNLKSMHLDPCALPFQYLGMLKGLPDGA